MPGGLNGDKIADNSLAESKLAISNEPAADKYLRGDYTWVTPMMEVTSIFSWTGLDSGRHPAFQSQTTNNTATVADIDDYILFFVRCVWNERIRTWNADDSSTGHEPDRMQKSGILFRVEMGPYSTGAIDANEIWGRANGDLDNFQLSISGTSVTATATVQSRVRTNNRTEVPPNFTLYGVKQDIA